MDTSLHFERISRFSFLAPFHPALFISGCAAKPLLFRLGHKQHDGNCTHKSALTTALCQRTELSAWQRHTFCTWSGAKRYREAKQSFSTSEKSEIAFTRLEFGWICRGRAENISCCYVFYVFPYEGVQWRFASPFWVLLLARLLSFFLSNRVCWHFPWSTVSFVSCWWLCLP